MGSQNWFQIFKIKREVMIELIKKQRMRKKVMIIKMNRSRYHLNLNLDHIEIKITSGRLMKTSPKRSVTSPMRPIPF